MRDDSEHRRSRFKDTPVSIDYFQSLLTDLVLTGLRQTNS
jgi:hypothetical protein